jgi:hypothetical protein
MTPNARLAKLGTDRKPPLMKMYAWRGIAVLNVQEYIVLRCNLKVRKENLSSSSHYMECTLLSIENVKIFFLTWIYKYILSIKLLT